MKTKFLITRTIITIVSNEPVEVKDIEKYRKEVKEKNGASRVNLTYQEIPDKEDENV